MNFVISQGKPNSDRLRHIDGDFVIGGCKPDIEHLIQELIRTSSELTQVSSDWTGWLEICSVQPLTS